MRKKGFKKIEFFLAIIIAVFLIFSLLSQSYLNLPKELTSLLLLAFVIIKLVDIIKEGGTIFEDFVSLFIIIIFGVIHFFINENVNSIIITAMIFILIFSVGMIPLINTLLISRRISSFILNYAFFIFMIILLFAGIYFANNENFLYLGKPEILSFEDSLYFSAISFTTVGYGDITPIGLNKLIASIQAVSSMILNIAFIGYVLSSRRFTKANS